MLTHVGKVQITAGHFPALMYPEDGYSSDAPENNLLKSPLMATVCLLNFFEYLFDIIIDLSCYHDWAAHCQSAKGCTQRRDTVKLGQEIDCKDVCHHRSIPRDHCLCCNNCNCSAAVNTFTDQLESQTCFALDTQVEWCDQDTEFVYFNNILLLFKDAEWRADVIQWYNM